MNATPEPPNFDHDELDKKIRVEAMEAALDSLRGMFDGLIIIGTWQTETGGSATYYRGDGNWYTQNGLIDYLYRKRMASAQIEAEMDAAREDED